VQAASRGSRIARCNTGTEIAVSILTASLLDFFTTCPVWLTTTHMVEDGPVKTSCRFD